MSAILYAHGFASDGNSQKVAALKAAFPAREVIAPAFSHRAAYSTPFGHAFHQHPASHSTNIRPPVP
jgi:hypothetical protein